MTGFFDSVRPGQEVTRNGETFELPILYFRDDLFILFFSADADKIRTLMPSDKLHPVMLPGNKTMVGIAAFNYIDTSIGPYGEVGVVIPTVYGTKPPMILPALREGKYPNFGTLVAHLPVTNTTARNAGRGEWGYTKFVADMHFTITPEYFECQMSEEGKHILTTHVTRRGIVMKDKKPLITYSVKDGNLIKTTIPQVGAARMCLNPKGSFLELGDHEVSDSIRTMGLSKKPIQSRYYVERSGILPSGEIIETGVRPLEGYYGKDRQGKHIVDYTGGMK